MTGLFHLTAFWIKPVPTVLQPDYRWLFIVNVITALSYAFILPIMTVFLVEGINTPPVLIGIYTVGVSVSGIVAAQWFGRLVDAGISAKRLFLVAIGSLMIAATAFAFLTNFWGVWLVGITFMALGNGSVPMLLTMIRRRITQKRGSATSVNAQMRAGVSLVWILGPALAFMLIGRFGFEATFLVAVVFGFLVLAVSQRWLPDLDIARSGNPNNPSNGKPPITIALAALGGWLMMGNAAHGLHITAMPLYLLRDLKTSTDLPGLLLGLTAAVELPVMLLTPRWTARWGLVPVLVIGMVAAAVYYSGLYSIQNPVGLMAIQLLNGLFFGIFVGLGLTAVQNHLAEHSGFASAFYTSALRTGSMVGTALAGVLGQYLGFHNALLGSLILALGALLCLGVVWLKPDALPGVTAPASASTETETG